MLSCWRLTPAMKNFGILNLLFGIVTNYRELSMNLLKNLTFNIQHLTFRTAALKLLSYSQIDKRLEQYRDVKPPRAVLQVIQVKLQTL